MTLQFPAPPLWLIVSRAGFSRRSLRPISAFAWHDRGVRGGLRLLSLATTLVLLTGASCTSSDGGKPQLTVNGKKIAIASPTWSVADALSASGTVLRSGMFTSVVTGRPLEPNGNAASLTVDGDAVLPTARIHRDTQIKAVNGADTVEPVENRLAYGEPPPLPPAVTSLWHPGRGPVEQQTVGKLSGEVVSRTAIGPAIPPQPEEGKVVALSFDDGPDPKWTPSILAILKDEGVPATFCVVGSSAKRHTDLVQSETVLGHTLCNHTMDHAHMTKRAHDDMVAQMVDCTAVVTSAGVPAPTLFRAPYGELSPDVTQTAQAQGMEVFGWNIDPADYRKPASSTIVARVLAQLKPGGIVLMHDGGGDRSSTVAALRPLIRALKAQGWSFSTPTRQSTVSPPP
ncbi:MAG TPA: polysaccharide deacetylase family protein [Acidimicrobiales bacterium]|nr:polysaccharide deacetylase family protein [Acidimicrobiales bacterium]